MYNNVLDKKEEEALNILDDKYKKFIEKSLINKGSDKLIEKAKEIFPQQWQDFFNGKIDDISDMQIWKKVMEMASDGFVTLQGLAAKYTIRESDIVRRMQKLKYDVTSLDDFFQIRSYDIEKVINSNDWKLYIQNIIQAAPTGFVGMPAIPVNIIVSTFLQFRAIQLIAMHYGYNVKTSQTEMDYASSVYLQVISKGKISDVDGYGEMITKMMAQAELHSLRNALTSRTYTEMAKEGGIQLLYVQMRAITNKSALKALDFAAEKKIENKALQKILESLSKNMSQKSGAKSLPIIAAILSVLIDTHQINKVIRIANIIYQKRFLLDKEMLNYSATDDAQRNEAVLFS